MARHMPDFVAASPVSTDTVKSKGKKRVSDSGVGGESKRLRMEVVKGGGKELPQAGMNTLGESRNQEGSAGSEQQAEAGGSGTQSEEQPFRLMDLPPEIRLEIYRACLTRPFDILLAKKPAPAREMGELEYHPDNDDHEHVMVVDSSTPRNTPIPTGPATSNGAPHWAGFHRPPIRVLGAGSGANTHASTAPPSTSRTTRSQTAAAVAAATTSIIRSNPTARPRRPPPVTEPTARAPRPQDSDPLIVPLLSVSKLVYKEARNVMYGENCFELDLETAQPTLSALHQRSRGQIKNLRLTIPTHNEILERFAEVVRLSLRYCWRLQRFHIHMPFVLPGADGSGTSGNTTVYANAFDILRWLPRQCEVVLEGNVCDEIRSVVDRNANLAKSLDELAYARRQLISNEGDRLPISDPPVA